MQSGKSMQKGGNDPTALLVPLILLGLRVAVENPKKLESVSKKLKSSSKSRKSSKMSGGASILPDLNNQMQALNEMLGGFDELVPDSSVSEEPSVVHVNDNNNDNVSENFVLEHDVLAGGARKPKTRKSKKSK